MNETAPNDDHSSNYEALEQHLEHFFGPLTSLVKQIIPGAVPLDLLHFAANEDMPYHIICTSGMSAFEIKVPEDSGLPTRMEFMVALPESWNFSEEGLLEDKWFWPLRMAVRSASFPHMYNVGINAFQTLSASSNPDESYDESVGFNSALILPADYFFDKLETVQLKDNRYIQLNFLIPLYPKELQFKLENNFESLLKKLSESGITPVVDIQRESFA